MSGYAPVERRCLSLNDNAVRTHGSHTIHLDSPSVVQCSAREEDLTTPCWELAQITEQDKQADSGHRCPAHQEQYRQSYGRYRAAKEKVKERRGMMPTMVEIAGMTDPFVVVEKQKGVELYLDALEDERAGRKLHSIRFFNSQMDEGHTERYGNVEREIRRAKELLVHLVGQNQSLGFPMRRNVTVQHTTHSPHAAPLTQEVVGESYPRTNDPVNLTNCGSRDALSTINLNATRRQIPEHGADPCLPPDSGELDYETNSPPVVFERRTLRAAVGKVAPPEPTHDPIVFEKRTIPQAPVDSVPPPEQQSTATGLTRRLIPRAPDGYVTPPEPHSTPTLFSKRIIPQAPAGNVEPPTPQNPPTVFSRRTIPQAPAGSVTPPEPKNSPIAIVFEKRTIPQPPDESVAPPVLQSTPTVVSKGTTSDGNVSVLPPELPIDPIVFERRILRAPEESVAPPAVPATPTVPSKRTLLQVPGDSPAPAEPQSSPTVFSKTAPDGSVTPPEPQSNPKAIVFEKRTIPQPPNESLVTPGLQSPTIVATQGIALGGLDGNTSILSPEPSTDPIVFERRLPRAPDESMAPPEVPATPTIPSKRTILQVPGVSPAPAEPQSTPAVFSRRAPDGRVAPPEPQNNPITIVFEKRTIPQPPDESVAPLVLQSTPIAVSNGTTPDGNTSVSSPEPPADPIVFKKRLPRTPEDSVAPPAVQGTLTVPSKRTIPHVPAEILAPAEPQSTPIVLSKKSNPQPPNGSVAPPALESTLSSSDGTVVSPVPTSNLIDFAKKASRASTEHVELPTPTIPSARTVLRTPDGSVTPSQPQNKPIILEKALPPVPRGSAATPVAQNNPIVFEKAIVPRAPVGSVVTPVSASASVATYSHRPGGKSPAARHSTMGERAVAIQNPEDDQNPSAKLKPLSRLKWLGTTALAGVGFVLSMGNGRSK